MSSEVFFGWSAAVFMTCCFVLLVIFLGYFLYSCMKGQVK